MSWEAELEQVGAAKSETRQSGPMCAVCQFEGRNQQASKPMDFLSVASCKQPITSFTETFLS